MGLWSTIRAAWSIGKAINGFRRDVQNRGKDRLSPDMSIRDRRRIEREILEFIDHAENSTIEKWFGKLLDAAGLRKEATEYAAGLLKSTNLSDVLHSSQTLIREQARKAILDGARDAGIVEPGQVTYVPH